MDIGTAIKFIRKEKGIGQKQLAESCGISANALSQIEINSSFPQKQTIKKICDALEIPISYLLFFSITDEDVPDDKKLVFNSLNTAIKSVLINKKE